MLRRHRQQQRDLQSRITQKKKSATKKTRKGVNDECAELERQLKEQQSFEITHDRRAKSAGDKDSSDGESPAEYGASGVESLRPDGGVPDLQSLSVSDLPAANDHAKKPSRQKARLARRAAEQEATIKQAEEEAAHLPDQRELERQSMQAAYEAKGLTRHDIPSDGHCLYAAVADQLLHDDRGLKPVIKVDVDTPAKADYRYTRHVAAAYIEQNADDFLPFLEEPLPEYLEKIRDTGEWGGHLEVLALAKAYGVDISILHASGQVDNIQAGSEHTERPLWLAFYRHSHGLGEHYNSLRRKD